MLALSRKKISLVLALLLITGFALTSWLSYHVAQDSIEQQISQDSLPLTSDNIYSEIQHDLFKPIFISSLMAQDTFLRDWHLAGEKDPQRVIKFLNEIKSKFNVITSYYISDLSGQYYHPTGSIKTISEQNPDDAWYYRAKALPIQQNYEVNIDQDAADPTRIVVFVNFKVKDYQENFIGVTGVGLSLDVVKNLIESYQQKYQRTVYFVDKNGMVTLHGKQFRGSENINADKGLKSIAAELLSTNAFQAQYKSKKGHVYLNSRWIDEFGWYLVVEQRAEIADRNIVDVFRVNLLLSLLVTIAILMLAHFVFNRYQQRLEKMATTDKLSGALNRQAFEMVFKKSMSQSQRNNSAASLVLLDIDNFKDINDQYGHLVGDQTIKKVSNICQDELRDMDYVCRWGGEEFLILLQNTNMEEAQQIAERIRLKLAQDQSNNAVTASFGLLECDPQQPFISMLGKVDKALYRAKDLGRNRIEIAE